MMSETLRSNYGTETHKSEDSHGASSGDDGRATPAPMVELVAPVLHSLRVDSASKLIDAPGRATLRHTWAKSDQQIQKQQHKPTSAQNNRIDS